MATFSKYSGITSAPTTPADPGMSATVPAPAGAPTTAPQTPKTYTPDDFANMIKQKYPQYQSQDNQTLTNAILQKYPQYQSMIQTPAAAPTQQKVGFLKGLGQDLVKGSVGQEIIGIGKGIGQTAVGALSLGQNALQSVGNAIANPISKVVAPGTQAQGQTTIGKMVGDKLAPKGGWQVAGNIAEQVGELATPTDLVSAGKDTIQGIVDASKLPEFADASKLGKAAAYTVTKVLKALPEAAVGTAYGLLHGQTVKQSLETGGIFGVLSAGGEAAGDVWKAVKGDVSRNVSKALGMTGKLSPTQAVEKVPQSLRALTTMEKLADDITVKTVDGVEKTWEPAKDGYYEGLQALQQTKQKIYDSYTALAQQAGDKGAAFTTDDFSKLAGDIQNSVKDSTTAFKNKAASLVSDIEDNFGTKDAQGNVTFSNTDLGRIQSFLEKINTDVNPLSDKAGAEVSGTASKSIRGILDSKIQDATGEGYQTLRNSYSDLKSIENDMVNQFKKSARKIGGGFGGYIEGFGTLDTIIGALTRSPVETLRGVGMDILGKTMSYLKDPENALRNVFQQISPEGVSAVKNRLVGGPTASAIESKGASDLAKQAADLTKKNGGVTINLDGDIPNSGFSVATSKATEKVVPQEDFNKDPVGTVKKYITDNFDQLKKEGVHFGAWIDNGKVYFDVPSVFKDKTAAVKAAQAADQLGIFDLKNFETIGKDQYEKIISDDEAGATGDSGAVQPASSSSDEGQRSNGQTGKANSPGGTKGKSTGTSLEDRIAAERKAIQERLKKTPTK